MYTMCFIALSVMLITVRVNALTSTCAVTRKSTVVCVNMSVCVHLHFLWLMLGVRGIFNVLSVSVKGSTLYSRTDKKKNKFSWSSVQITSQQQWFIITGRKCVKKTENTVSYSCYNYVWLILPCVRLMLAFC